MLAETNQNTNQNQNTGGQNVLEQEAPPEKCFHCENGKTFRSVAEFEGALKSCNVGDAVRLFHMHANESKNDFANWIRDVFGLNDLAERIRPITDPLKMLEELKKYDEEKKQELQLKLKQTNQIQPAIKELKVEEVKAVVENKKENIAKETPQINPQMPALNNNETIEGQDRGARDQYSVHNQEIEYIKGKINERGDNADKEFDRVKRIKRQSFFNKADFEDTVEDLKNRYDDLVRVVSEHRKGGQDMSIPAMMLRNIHPKIVYFQISQNKADHDFIVQLLEEVEHEINYAKNVKKLDLKNEVLEAVGIFKNKKEE